MRKDLRQSYSVGAHPKIVLGKEQDAYRRRFDLNQSFVEETGDLYTWDFALSAEDMLFAHQGSSFNFIILSW